MVYRVACAPYLALCACMAATPSTPAKARTDHVECTDTTEKPFAALVGAIASAGVLAYAATNPQAAVDHGGLLWMPVLGIASVDWLVDAAEGYSSGNECKVAKRRAAEQGSLAKAKSDARARAGTLWKRAAAAARADDCVTVRDLDPKVRELDVEFHAVVFSRDVAIARCLATPIGE
jgi:hypothetical protein